MGLDTVELIMRIEEEFEIEIEDDEAAQISDAGQMLQFLALKLQIQPSSRCLSSATFYQMRRALIDLTGTTRRDITPQTPMSRLLPTSRRRELWQQLAQSNGANLPDLLLPEWLITGIVVGFAGFCVAALGLALGNSFLLSSAIFLAGIGYLWLMFTLTRPLARCFPPSCQTVGATTRIAMLSHLKSAPSQPVSAKTSEL